MSSDYSMTRGSSFDYDVVRVVAGDAESLRARLLVALEQMGYQVINENPIQARRGASSQAETGCSQDILDYRRTLDIGLKSAGSNATRVTFAYAVNVVTGYMTKGDRHTLTREAEAIIALAESRAALSYCPSCGADVAGGARFCRQCGFPRTASNPAELDLLRLTANANASYKNILMGAIFILSGLLTPALLLLFKHDTMTVEKLLKLTALLASLVSTPGVFFLLAGLWRLGRAISRKPEHDELSAAPRRGFAEELNPPAAAALPPQSTQHPIQHPITEVTTGLLPQEVKRTNDLN